MMTPFVPLRLHSEFSLTDGTIRVPEAVDFAEKQGFPALALTDAMNMFAAVKFYKECRKKGIVPIFGVDCLMTPSNDKEEPTRLLLLAKNHNGYLRLCELLTAAYTDENRFDDAQISWQMLENADRSGLICLSGGIHSEIAGYLLKDKFDLAVQSAQQLAALFPDAFYLELQQLPDYSGNFTQQENQRFHEINQQYKTVFSGCLKLAGELDLPPVATHPAQFMTADDFVAHETRVCIASGDALADPKRIRHFHPSQYFLSFDEIQTLFKDIPEAIENTVEIAKRCATEIDLGHHYLPLFPTPDGVSLDNFLRQQANDGLQERLKILYPNEEERNQRLPEYQNRLDYELGIIIQMGFPGYFLIVADFINWAKNNGCPVGPGRGSGAGSLVAYSLKITDLDPLRYALLFERFLNPERVSMPDFDVDFCTNNRDRVIDYVRHKYGENAVSQIVTFGTLSSKAVIRDVGRVLGLSFGLCDKLSKLIPLEANKPLPLAKAMEMEPLIGKILQEEEAEELMVLAQKLEDLTRGTGMHAGGVLIAPGKLSDFCPVYQADKNAASVSMYDKDDVEQAGLVKFDFLGLRNLTIIQMAEKMIAALRGESVDVAHIPLDDERVYRDIFAAGNTNAVFQFESVGMKKMLKEAKPTKFEEIIAFVALYRPGPMDLIPDFIRRMHGKEKFEYLHPTLSEVLQPTYGIMVYQEQVMQTAQVCAGYSLGGADMLRRAMGKKKVEEMVKQRATFVQGAAEKNIPEEKANEIFDYMEKFAGYGFNKSHAAAYALVAYQTAWLKKHYTVEFIAATMSNELTNTDQLKNMHDDAIANGISFLPPDINRSMYQFEPVSTSEIRYALGAIKGTGEAACKTMIREREKNGDFKDIFDFCRRIDNQTANRRVIEALIKAGTFDSLHPNRAEVLANLEMAMEYGVQQNDNANQGGLFDEVSDAIEEVKLTPHTAWSLSQLLAEEKQVLGFYFSAHPFSPYAEEIRPRTPLNAIAPAKERQWISGFVIQTRTIFTQKGNKMMIVAIEDENGKCEIIPRNDALEEYKNTYGEELTADQVLLFECTVSQNPNGDTEQLRISAYKMLKLDTARQNYARALHLTVTPTADIPLLAHTLQQHTQGERKIPLKFLYHNAEKNFSGSLNASEQWLINPNQALIDDLHGQLGYKQVQVKW
ncbi:MAG: DNA polymerase III subunit alpha [Neisseriaceae bacterium]|nr:DNA polymerase III subunit alpha [Neisseriaceae bacterium]